MLRALLDRELFWQMIFADLRFGWPGGDTRMPDPQTANLRWFRKDEKPPRTEDERKFRAKHWAEHAREADAEFTEKVVLAAPRDLPAKLDQLRILIDPRTNAGDVRRVCKQLNNRLPPILFDRARAFCRAKRDKRFPGSKRPSSIDKRIEYLSRVMAGLTLSKPIRPATAVDILRKMKHGRNCGCWRCMFKIKQKRRERKRAVT
jgi:hypothetical protein